jgi:hypothetical protein
MRFWQSLLLSLSLCRPVHGMKARAPHRALARRAALPFFRPAHFALLGSSRLRHTIVMSCPWRRRAYLAPVAAVKGEQRLKFKPSSRWNACATGVRDFSQVGATRAPRGIRGHRRRWLSTGDIRENDIQVRENSTARLHELDVLRDAPRRRSQNCRHFLSNHLSRSSACKLPLG